MQTGKGRRQLLLVTLLAVGAQTASMLAVARLRGSPTAYAYQSPDAREYVALARGLAWKGCFCRLDAQGTQESGPDTWRTPGYPAFLAVAIRLFGDDTLTLLIVQQLLGVASVALCFMTIRFFAAERWALIAAIAWALDPFRIYYGLWLMAGTLFVSVLLLLVYLWSRWQTLGTDGTWTIRCCLTLGVVAGAAVLIRPIGVFLPPLAWLGIGLVARRRSAGCAVACALMAVAGTAALVGPWMFRNHLVSGHLTLTHQSGASFAYHKVVDVVLWSQGRSSLRFDAAATDEIRTQIDERLQTRWQDRYGPLTDQQRSQLTWRKLNFGETEGIDAAAASSLLWSVGMEMLADRKAAMSACFAVQGLNLLVFPLGLILDPPASSGGSPMSMLLGGSSSIAATILPLCIGLVYAALACTVVVRVVTAAWRRYWPVHFFVLWPVLGLFVLTLPFEDPRFRVPLVPLMLLLAVVPVASCGKT